MLPELRELRQRRKKSGITQSELAKRSGVSQSLVAKTESCRIDPSYSSVRKMLECLDDIESRNDERALSVMNRKVITIDKDESVSCTIGLMRKFNLSQLPVTSGGLLVGSISEKAILDKMIDCGNMCMSEMKVSLIMEDSFPTISETTPLRSVLVLLRHSQAVIVTKKEEICGIITKADVLRVA